MRKEDGTISDIVGDRLSGFRNRIINGGMVIDQRNAGASVTASDSMYVVDRWKLEASPASKFSVQQNAGSVTPPVGHKNYLGLTSLSAYSVTSSDYQGVQQRIEGFNVSDLGWGTANAQSVTVSFWVRSSLTGTFGGSAYNSASNRSYPFTYAIASSNTWEQKTVTIPGDTSGTWTTDNTAGITLSFGIGVGSTYAGTAGAWASALYFSASGTISVVGTNAATFYITGVQLEKGLVATPFETRSYGTELALCQRYFENGNQPLFYANGITSTEAFGEVKFCTTKRAAPTITFSGWQYYSAGSGAGFTPSSTSSTVSRFGFTALSLTSWNGWVGAGTWTSSSEL
jgi:hypothetical protein